MCPFDSYVETSVAWIWRKKMDELCKINTKSSQMKYLALAKLGHTTADERRKALRHFDILKKRVEEKSLSVVKACRHLRSLISNTFNINEIGSNSNDSSNVEKESPPIQYHRDELKLSSIFSLLNPWKPCKNETKEALSFFVVNTLEAKKKFFLFLENNCLLKYSLTSHSRKPTSHSYVSQYTKELPAKDLTKKFDNDNSLYEVIHHVFFMLVAHVENRFNILVQVKKEHVSEKTGKEKRKYQERRQH